MARYIYKAVNKENKLVGGVVSASTKRAAEKMIKKDGATIVFVAREVPAFYQKQMRFSLSRFSRNDKIYFFRNLAMMTAAGLVMNQALFVLESQLKSQRIKKTIQSMRGDIENGKKLSQAMKRFPRHFSEFITEAVGVGEVTGEVSTALDRISVDLERDHELSQKIVGALTYPLVVLGVMVLVVIGLIVFVLPKIAELFIELRTPMPLPTRILVGIGAFIGGHPILLGSAVLGLIILIYSLLKIKKVHYFAHVLMLRLPIFGELIKEFNLARLFRALESLVSSGVSLVRAVEISEKVVKNDAYKKALKRMHPVLLHGAKLNDSLKPYPFLFPLQAQSIVEVGENTGKYGEAFSRIHGHYERSLNHRTRIMSTLLEPVLMVVIGFVVGGLAISIFMPIYQVSTVF